MATTRLRAQMTVTSSAEAETWFAQLFGRAPDPRPMAGLLEWHLADSFGVFTGPLSPRRVAPVGGAAGAGR